MTMGPSAYYGSISPVLALAFFGMIIATVAAGPAVSSTVSPQAAYRPQEETAASNYVPHATYPYADSYGIGPVSPYEAGYLYPTYPTGSGYMSTIMPAAQGALSMALKLFSKVGLFLFGGIALFVVGGIFTTAVCSLTPLCTISFNGLSDFDKDSMRSLMSPDKISAAAALVQDAIGKYNTLNRNPRN